MARRRVEVECTGTVRTGTGMYDTMIHEPVRRAWHHHITFVARVIGSATPSEGHRGTRPLMATNI